MQGDHAREELAGTRFFDVRWESQTGSTNADLLALAAEGAPDGLVLVADHQTAGHGRLGRSWEAPSGTSLLCSTLLRPRLPLDLVHLVSLAVGVAASDACETVTGLRPSLKWPNDLILPLANGEERKVGGILAESSIRGDEVAAVVVGMGVNVNWPDDLPDELASIATSLNHHVGREIDREELLVAHLRGLERILDGLESPDGRDALLLRYRELSSTLGRKVRADLGSGSISGEAVDISPEGHLVVELAGERISVSAGDVVHLRPTD